MLLSSLVGFKVENNKKGKIMTTTKINTNKHPDENLSHFPLISPILKLKKLEIFDFNTSSSILFTFHGVFDQEEI